MCSSGAFLNFGHTSPRIKAHKVWLNDVAAYGGVAAVDCYLGAAEVAEGDPLNSVFPGEFNYGGAHVIEDLVAGNVIRLRLEGYGTDCYPSRKQEKNILLHDLRDAMLFNPRNCYQNYNCAVNMSDKTIYTYMGVLRPRMANANYATAGQLSPMALPEPREGLRPVGAARNATIVATQAYQRLSLRPSRSASSPPESAPIAPPTPETRPSQRPTCESDMPWART